MSESDRVVQRQNERLDPDDRKVDDRAVPVGRRTGEYEDIEADRASRVSRRPHDDADEASVAEADLTDEIDLDAPEQGDGPDA
ncbi:MAG: hypothetical protein H0T89_36015 [Deltaproteobacteria bacterium]|nr:hypothetical protein [Deltaproteobacteria bacterium]MDQ3299153.1 hypothetical protein [Myxococcota bacterium]